MKTIRDVMRATFLIVQLLLPVLGQRAEAQASSGSAQGIPKGYVLIEGDIVIKESDLTAGAFDTDLWPEGNVPFEFDVNVNATNQAAMLVAMQQWENVATVDFVVRSGEPDYVHIRDASSDSIPGCNSLVGMQGGEQIINIASGCWPSTLKMAHELGHCLGFWHEQTRPDRDDYVQIDTSNILDADEHNFDIKPAADVYPKQEYGLHDSLTYDFDSVMHYGDDAFCIDCSQPTIIVLPPNDVIWQDRIGQRDHLSILDQLTMSFLYPEFDWSFVDQTETGTENGTFLEPFHTFTTAMNSSHPGTLWIQPGTYSEDGTFTTVMTIKAPLGNVVLGSGTAAKISTRGEPSGIGQENETALPMGTSLLSAIPAEFGLSRNYPNPFNPATTIRYDLKEDSRVSVKIYNMLGQEVAAVVDEFQTAGYKSVTWNGTNGSGQQVASGLYLCRMQAGDFLETRRMMLLK